MHGSLQKQSQRWWQYNFGSLKALFYNNFLKKHIRPWTRLGLQCTYTVTARSSIDQVFSSDTDGKSSSIRNLVCPVSSTVHQHQKTLSPTVLEQVSRPKLTQALLEGKFQSHYWQVDFANYPLTSEFLNWIIYNLFSPTLLKKRADQNFVLTYSEGFNIKHPDACFFTFLSISHTACILVIFGQP